MEKTCCYCKRGEFIPLKYKNIYFSSMLGVVDKDTKRLYIEINGSENEPLGEVSMSIKYCPFCGRKLKKD